jgi:hypothetical protein
MGFRLRIRVPVAAAAVILMGLVVVTASSAATGTTAHTKLQAERNLLRVAAQRWGHARIPDLVDARTGLLKNNVRSICRGQGGGQKGKRFHRFACVLRPWPFQTRQELHLTYRALSSTRFQLRWVRVRRR